MANKEPDTFSLSELITESIKGYRIIFILALITVVFSYVLQRVENTSGKRIIIVNVIPSTIQKALSENNYTEMQILTNYQCDVANIVRENIIVDRIVETDKETLKSKNILELEVGGADQLVIRLAAQPLSPNNKEFASVIDTLNTIFIEEAGKEFQTVCNLQITKHFYAIFQQHHLILQSLPWTGFGLNKNQLKSKLRAIQSKLEVLSLKIKNSDLISISEYEDLLTSMRDVLIVFHAEVLQSTTNESFLFRDMFNRYRWLLHDLVRLREATVSLATLRSSYFTNSHKYQKFEFVRNISAKNNFLIYDYRKAFFAGAMLGWMLVIMRFGRRKREKRNIK